MRPLRQMVIEDRRIPRLIQAYVDHCESRCFFNGSANADNEALQLLCVRVTEMLSKMDEAEKDAAFKLMTEDVMQSDVKRRNAYEETVDEIAQYAHSVGAVSTIQMIMCIICTTDFMRAARHTIDKFSIINDNLHLVDYKEARSIVKLLVDKVHNVPMQMTREQRRLVVVAEDVLLYIMDRNTNALPALFALSEISAASKRGSRLLLPRVSARATQLDNTFRPIAELAYVTGRSYFIPIPYHPAFHVTCTQWKIDATNARMSHRLHLPYKIELYDPQTYMLLMLLKQPRGKDFLLRTLRQGSPHSAKAPLDNILIVQVMEAMVSGEKAANECNKHVWDNIVDTLFYTLNQGWCDLNRFLVFVTKSITRAPYRKGRDQLMWTILQMVSYTTSSKLSTEAVESIGKLYSCLYDEEEQFVASNFEPSRMARALAAACIWKSVGASSGLAPPSPSLNTQIEFITAAADNADDDGMLAVIANAYAPNTREHKRVCSLLLSKLRPSEAARAGHSTPLSYDLLESLGLRGENNLLKECMSELSEGGRGGGALPDAALVETTCRLMCMLDQDQAQKINLASNIVRCISALKSGECKVELLFILIEMCIYRCIVLPLLPYNRYNLLAAAFMALTLECVQSCMQLYSQVEDLIVRLSSWLLPADCVSTISPHKSPSTKKSFAVLDHTNPDGSKLCPELFRLLFFNYLRASKVTGQDVGGELMYHIGNAFAWTPSQLLSCAPSLSAALQAKVAEATEDGAAAITFNPPSLTDEKKDLDMLEQEVHSDFMQLSGLHHSVWSDYFLPHNGHPRTTLFAAYLRYMTRNGNSNSAVLLQMVSRMRAPHVVSCTNVLVNFLVHLSLNNGVDECFSSVKDALAVMMFEMQVVPLHRVFFAVALGSRSDEASIAALSLMRAITRMTEWKERVALFSHLPRINSPDYVKKNMEFNLKYPERSIIGASRIPVFYSNQLIRLLPYVDLLLEKSLQLSLKDDHFAELLNAFSPLYKLHSFPLTISFNMLSALYDHIGHSPRAKQLMLGVVKNEGCALSPYFSSFDHGGDAVTLAATLMHTLVVALDCASPQDQVYVKERAELGVSGWHSVGWSDWRVSEVGPSGVALFAIACELIASPFTPPTIIAAFIHLLHTRCTSRPLVYVNAVALILTSLPLAYMKHLMQHIIACYSSEPLREMELEEIVFDTLEQQSLSSRSNETSTVLALVQACWHHAAVPTLLSFVEDLRDELEERVKSEKELFFTMHIIIPLLQRVADAKDKKKIDVCVRVVVLMYKLLANVSEKNPLQKEDTMCDLFYQFKYLFVGDFVRGEISDLINNMRPSIRNKLKYIIPPSESRVEILDDSSAQGDSVDNLTGVPSHRPHPPLATSNSLSQLT